MHSQVVHTEDLTHCNMTVSRGGPAPVGRAVEKVRGKGLTGLWSIPVPGPGSSQGTHSPVAFPGGLEMLEMSD